jgi:hypothetical protein
MGGFLNERIEAFMMLDPTPASMTTAIVVMSSDAAKDGTANPGVAGYIAPIALIWPIHMYLAKVIIIIYNFIKVDDENDDVRNRLRFRTSLFSSHQSEKEKLAERLSE